jgi:5-deoxy-glucuronate isomerase
VIELSKYHLPGGEAGSPGHDVDVSPESASWSYSSLRVVSLSAGGSVGFSTGDDEIIVLPLSGAVAVAAGDARLDLRGRENVFSGPSDLAYVGIGQAVTLRSERGGRFALCGARTDQAFPPRRIAAENVPVELRGAGQSSRQVRNFGTPDSLEAAKIIACEVITPAGNWSSYPAHKHDEASDTESELEEIYYFEIAAGPQGEPGFGFMRTSSSPGKDIDFLEEVHDRDTVLVPYGWHGPCVAAPGFDMYYLNVMAGPGTERAWMISDHPDQAWVRDTWKTQDVDPRLVSTPEEA